LQRFVIFSLFLSQTLNLLVGFKIFHPKNIFFTIRSILFAFDLLPLYLRLFIHKSILLYLLGSQIILFNLIQHEIYLSLQRIDFSLVPQVKYMLPYRLLNVLVHQGFEIIDKFIDFFVILGNDIYFAVFE